MIEQTGILLPTKQQLKLIRASADESFCATCPDDFGDIPIFAGFRRACALTALALKNVEPHNDPWVGDDSFHDGEDGPEHRRAVFWVLHLPKYEHLHVQVGNSAVRLSAGGWILFDDRLIHGVYSQKKWFGLAYQLRPV